MIVLFMDVVINIYVPNVLKNKYSRNVCIVILIILSINVHVVIMIIHSKQYIFDYNPSHQKIFWIRHSVLLKAPTILSLNTIPKIKPTTRPPAPLTIELITVQHGHILFCLKRQLIH